MNGLRRRLTPLIMGSGIVIVNMDISSSGVLGDITTVRTNYRSLHHPPTDMRSPRVAWHPLRRDALLWALLDRRTSSDWLRHHWLFIPWAGSASAHFQRRGSGLRVRGTGDTDAT